MVRLLNIHINRSKSEIAIVQQICFIKGIHHPDINPSSLDKDYGLLKDLIVTLKLDTWN